MTVRLTKTHQKKLFQHIREKWGDSRECPMCHTTKWTVDASVYRLAALSTDPMEVHTVIQPVATVRCTNCSFLVMIHLTQSGIASAEDFDLDAPQRPAMVPHLNQDQAVVEISSGIDGTDDEDISLG